MIPYTCGLSRPFSGAVAGERSYICKVTWDYYQIITMKNLKDAKTKIFPSKTRGGKELPSSSTLDSPSVISKLATPPHAISSDMSQVIDDATSAMNATRDDASTLLDDNVPCHSLIFGPFFFICFSEIFARVSFFRGFVVWKLKKMPSSLFPK